MADLEVQPGWPSVRQLETSEFARGGASGNLNEQAKALLARTEYLNLKTLSVKDYGAIGDGTLHEVQEWTILGSKKYYANLDEIQEDYPHVTKLTDSIDWAAIQKALNTGKHILGSQGNYVLNKSLYYKTSGQNVFNLGTINIDASLGIPCMHIGASDTNGTRILVWRGSFKGTDFYGTGERAIGSCALNLVGCSQFEFNFRASGFYAGMGVTGACYANTFNTITLVQNTYGITDLNAAGDLQSSIFVGGRIEQNKLEGIKFRSVNIVFDGTVIEGNGLWDEGTGSTPEVTLLKSDVSGAVTFQGCYMESLDGKSTGGIIEIEPNAVRHVFINGGHYFGGVANKDTIFVVDIKSPAATVVSAILTGVYVNDVKNYVRGVISGNSRVSVINCFPREDLALTLNVTVGVGSPLIQQIDRSYHRTNQNVRAKSFQADEGINAASLTTSGNTSADYLLANNAILGLGLYSGNYTHRRRSMSSVATSFSAIPLSDIASTSVYLFEVIAVQRLSSSTGRSFKAALLIAGNNGAPIILNSTIVFNSDGSFIPTFSIDGTGVVIGNLNNAGLYDFYVSKHGRN